MPTDGRIFSEKEISKVLKRAAEIQTKRRNPVTYGLSIEELQELAAVSGLDPSVVQEAALELDSANRAETANWWGGPLSATHVRSIEGPLSDETWEEILAALRRRYKQTGETEQRGSTRQWMFSERDQQKGHLIATYKNGRTELELFWANPVLGIPFFVIPLILSLIALPIIFEELKLGGGAAFLAWISVVTVVLGAARFGLGATAGAARRKGADLADEVARIAAGRARARDRSGQERTDTGTQLSQARDLADSNRAPSAAEAKVDAPRTGLQIPEEAEFGKSGRTDPDQIRKPVE